MDKGLIDPTLHRTALTAKNYLVQYVSSAEIEKPWLRQLLIVEWLVKSQS